MSAHSANTSSHGQSDRLPIPAFKEILCAVDGKPGGYAAVEQAAALAGPEGRLTLLEVTSFRSAGAYRGAAIAPLRAKRILDQALRIAAEAGVPAKVEVEPGTPPSQMILDWSTGYDLLALGAPASSWLGGMLGVGVADRALASFVTPMLIARPLAAERRLLQRILVASDGLQGSDPLVELAGSLVSAGATVAAAAAGVALVHAMGHELPVRGHEARHRRLQAQRQLLAQVAGVSEALIAPGSAMDVIVATARKLDASLVVMGSRRLEGMRALGSVSRRVAHAAHCSVLLVPPEHLRPQQ